MSLLCLLIGSKDSKGLLANKALAPGRCCNDYLKPNPQIHEKLGRHQLLKTHAGGAQVGDSVVVDGGMLSLEVQEKAGPDVRCRVVDPGIILSRANLTFRRGGQILRGRNAMLPVLSSKVGLCWS